MIARKKKICSACGEEKYIFSHGKCKYCSNKTYVIKNELKLFGSDSKTIKKKAVSIFNKYIRLRDSKDGEFVCISCNVRKNIRQMNAGHYHSCTFENLRFDERNVNGQCIYCNLFKEGNFYGYTNGMMRKYGQETINELELKKNIQPK